MKAIPARTAMTRNSVASPALLALGITHRGVGLALRERLHFSPADAAALAARLASARTEAVVLSTCNRIEIYLAGSRSSEVAEQARVELSTRSGLTDLEVDELLVVRRDAGAAHHLFRVAAGLDSLLLGDAQILGQVREAHAHAVAAEATGRVLNRVFAHALHAGRRVRSETGIGAIPAAMPAAAAELAEKVIGSLEGLRVLVIGAGKMGEFAALAFRSWRVERVVVANHRIERARELASRFRGDGVTFERIGDELAPADVVVSSTRSARIVVQAEDVAAVLPRRAGRPLVLIDLAVPRDLDPTIGALDGCVLFDLEALGPIAAEAAAERAQAAARAEAIVAEEAAALARWLRSLDVMPVVSALRLRGEEIRAAELGRASSRLRGLSEADRRCVESLTSRILAKLLHEPTARLKADADPRHAETLAHLFGLREERA
jgi:glutamyl-tRNA reductase